MKRPRSNPLVTGFVGQITGATIRITGGEPLHVPASSIPHAIGNLIREDWSRRLAEAAFDPIFPDLITETETARGLARDLIPNWDPEWGPRKWFRGAVSSGFLFSSGIGLVDV